MPDSATSVTSVLAPLTIRGVRLANRVAMSPMSQKKALPDGRATDWHLVHYGCRAVGGVGLIMIEDCAVLDNGRTDPKALCLDSDLHIASLRRIVQFCHEQGAKVGIQLGHAGRRAAAPDVIGPSPIPFDPASRPPRELGLGEVAKIPRAFAAAAIRAIDAGIDVVELHASHGYLLHEFLSPLSNRRTDRYGGSPEARYRLVLETAQAIRDACPVAMPLFVRIAVSDGVHDGLELEEGLEVCAQSRHVGVDGFVPTIGRISAEARGIESIPEYTELVRRRTSAITVMTGGITSADEAERAISSGVCDLVALGRALLVDPYWVRHLERIEQSHHRLQSQ